MGYQGLKVMVFLRIEGAIYSEVQTKFFLPISSHTCGHLFSSPEIQVSS